MGMEDYTAVIQAGGKGTRLAALTKDKIPKPMLPLNGKPMLEWQIEQLGKYGIREVVIICGHLAEKIKEYFGDGREWGIQISYLEEKEPLGSAGALYFLRERLAEKNFLLIFGDVMFDIDMHRMADFHERKESLATLLVHPNAHPQDSDLILMDKNCHITGFIPKGTARGVWYQNCVNAGIYILNGLILNGMEEACRRDLEKELLFPMIGTGRIYGYRTPEYVKDAGTEERFFRAEREQREGIWETRNLRIRQKCVFLDRDGTINRYRGLLSREEELELEPGAAEAIRLLNRSAYLAVVVTNQPVVARGMCGVEDVERIHNKMETLLGEQGVYLDDVIFCPHHPDRGYPEENPAFKKVCDCRKPKTGMIDIMAEAYNIDLSASYMIGDSTTDIQTGINAGLKTVLVHTGVGGADGKYDVKADYETQDLLEAVRLILGKG